MGCGSLWAGGQHEMVSTCGDSARGSPTHLLVPAEHVRCDPRLRCTADGRHHAEEQKELPEDATVARCRTPHGTVHPTTTSALMGGSLVNGSTTDQLVGTDKPALIDARRRDGAERRTDQQRWCRGVQRVSRSVGSERPRKRPRCSRTGNRRTSEPSTPPARGRSAAAPMRGFSRWTRPGGPGRRAQSSRCRRSRAGFVSGAAR